MSASEIIEQIKTLPKDEQRQVFDFVRNVDADSQASHMRFAQDEATRKAGDEVVARYSEVFRRLAE